MFNGGAGPGTLQIKVCQAQLTHDIEFFSKQDPYARITLGSHVKETTVKKNAGKNPIWNETLSFVRATEDILTLQVFDKGSRKDILLGESVIPLKEFFKIHTKSEWHTLNLQGKSEGQILLIFTWQPINTQ